MFKIDFYAGNLKWPITNSDYHRHALHECPLQTASLACITSYVIE